LQLFMTDRVAVEFKKPFTVRLQAAMWNRPFSAPTVDFTWSIPNVDLVLIQAVVVWDKRLNVHQVLNWIVVYAMANVRFINNYVKDPGLHTTATAIRWCCVLEVSITANFVVMPIIGALMHAHRPVVEVMN